MTKFGERKKKEIERKKKERKKERKIGVRNE